MAPIGGEYNGVHISLTVNTQEEADKRFKDITLDEASKSVVAIFKKFPELEDTSDQNTGAKRRENTNGIINKNKRISLEGRYQNKLLEIKQAAGPKAVAMFQKAWDVTEGYDANKKEEKQKLLLGVEYEKGEDELGIILGCKGFDRKNKSYICGYTTPSVLQKYMKTKTELFPGGAGIKKGAIEYVKDKARFGDKDFIDFKESKIGSISNEERAQFFAREAEAKALKAWAGDDGLLVEALFDLGMPFGEWYGLWLAEIVINDYARTLYGFTNTLLHIFGHNQDYLLPVSGFQNSRSAK